MYCTVVTSSRASGIGNGLTYETEDTTIRRGFPVRVPLRNTVIEGIVMDISESRNQQEYDIRHVKEIIGPEPLLTEAEVRTVQWMADFYVCTLRQALSVWLPPPPWSRVLPRQIPGYRLMKAESPILRGKVQKAVAEYMGGKEWVSREALQQEIGASSAVLSALREKGIIAEEQRQEERQPFTFSVSPVTSLPVLTPAQEAAYEFMRGDKRPSLLFGVTGSGKTELYARMIAETIRDGRQAILLVPEILLTEHLIHRLESLFDRAAIAVVHSKLTEAERREEWKRIHRGEVALVIGSRSALFAPVQHLGLVILDEEHEWTYKNEQTPRYHARETAETLCRFANAKLVLGSATPSLESWARGKSGRYHLARLPQRFQERMLPAVSVIDLGIVQFATAYPFSRPLLDAIGERLGKQEQVVLFLNRRGIASALLCLACRRRIVNPESQLPFTVHHTSEGRPFLLDHTTGAIADVPNRCPHCQSTKLLPVGAGTQKIESVLRTFFPAARLLRADADTMQDPREMRDLLRRMREREADILLGTQSVVKGLDLPHVTLAAVVLADVGLSLPHFRAGERVFQLLTQLTGRSGRARPGEVIIQTFRPQAPEVAYAAEHKTEEYLESELRLRLFSHYPPASRMIRLLLRGQNAEIRARSLQKRLLELVEQEGSDVKVMCAPTFFGAGREWHVLLRGTDPRPLLSLIDLTEVYIDVDPMETL